MSLVSTLADIWKRFQGELFPELAEEVGELHTKHRKRWNGRPLPTASKCAKVAVRTTPQQRRRH